MSAARTRTAMPATSTRVRTLRTALAPSLAVTSLAVTSLATFGCGVREEVWSRPVGASVALMGLRGAAAIVDPEAERALLFPVERDLTLAPVSIPIGRGFAAAKTTMDREQLIVLSHGDVPRRTADDQGPSMVVIGGGTSPVATARYTLSDPLSGLSIDPASKFAVVYPSASDTSFVQNPNELVLIDLTKPGGPENPLPTSLRSFGGRPKSFTFTEPLSLPGGSRRLLVVETDRDVALLDLSEPAKPEITVKLTGGPQALEPVGVAVSDGEPEVDDDARIAVRLKDDPNVIVLDLLPAPAGEEGASPHSFRPTPNIVYVGGTPTDLAFVRTDGGLRLAALVPSRGVLTLVDPATGIGSDVELGAPYERISIVTDVVGGTTNGSDVALLWSGSSANIAFVELGVTVGKPYKSVEPLELAQPVSAVLDVPAPNSHLKILAAPDGRSFVVLNLLSRTAAPILASEGGTRVASAPDGARAWMFALSSSSVALLDLESLHPKNIVLSYPIQEVFDVERRDGGRALIAVHPLGALGLTVLDARSPSLETAIEYIAVLVGDF